MTPITDGIETLPILQMSQSLGLDRLQSICTLMEQTLLLPEIFLQLVELFLEIFLQLVELLREICLAQQLQAELLMAEALI